MSPQRLVGLYPAAWRRRYGNEFLALLEDRPPTGVAILDVAWGALDAHLFPQAPEGRFRVFTRIAGLAALGAGLIIVLGIFNIYFGSPEFNAIRADLIYGLAFLGLTGIHLRQVAVRPGLAWFGFLAAGAALVFGFAGSTLSLAGVLPPSGGEYGFVSGLGLWIGSVVLGATMLTIRVFPTVVGLLISVSAPLAMLGLVVGRADASAEAMGIAALAGALLYGVAWMGIGVSLLTAQPREGVLGPAA